VPFYRDRISRHQSPLHYPPSLCTFTLTQYTLFLFLASRLLDYDPARRPGASLCLAHRFIAGMSLSLSPPVCSPMHISPEEFDFEGRKPCIEDLRSEINYESK